MFKSEDIVVFTDGSKMDSGAGNFAANLLLKIFRPLANCKKNLREKCVSIDPHLLWLYPAFTRVIYFIYPLLPPRHLFDHVTYHCDI